MLVEQEVDRRLEEFVRRLMEQGIDPMKVEIDWREFRDRQREAAAETVKSTLVIDEIARRESIEATDEDVDAEIARFAERAGRTPAAVRARLEKEGALDRIRGRHPPRKDRWPGSSRRRTSSTAERRRLGPRGADILSTDLA